MTQTVGTVGIFSGPDDEVFVNFCPGDQGQPLQNLLPVSAHGAGFDDFNVQEYFNYAQLWMITPEQWRAFDTDAKFAGLGKTQPYHVPTPGVDLPAYDALHKDGTPNNPHLAQLFSVIAQLWDHEPLISPQANLFFNLYRSGLTPKEMFDHIVAKAAQGQPDDQGVLQLDRVKPDIGFRQASSKTLGTAAGKVAAKQMKKKRKQGRLNRKRGRR